ncbi:hypothetical protein MO973_02780 [Paenibacillus sp. TRM 82003]|nr:hypothetical protein [Paenibacillus sp. TRM 82003]
MNTKTPSQPTNEDIAAAPRSYLQRIWKYRLHYVIVLPALLLIFLFKLVPLATALYLPFIDYKPFHGLFGSEWVGSANFEQLFAMPEFGGIVSNTVAFKVGAAVATAAVGFVAALSLHAVRSARLRAGLTTLFLAPYVLPAVVLAYVAIHVLSPTASPFFTFETFVLAEPGLFRPVAVLLEALRLGGIPAIVALAAIHARQTAADGGALRGVGYGDTVVVPALRAVCAFAIIQLSTLFSSSFELLYPLQNPLNYETADTLDAFIVRSGLMMANFSVASAAWLLQFAANLVCTVGAYLLVRGAFAKDLFGGSNRGADASRPSEAGSKSAPAGAVVGTAVAGLYGLAVLFPLYVLFVHPFIQSSAATVGPLDILQLPNAVLYMAAFGFAVVVHLLMTATLAYPLTVRRLPGRNAYKLFLLVAMTAGAGTIHEFLTVRSWGALNTIFPVVLTGFVSIVPVFVLKSIFNARYAGEKARLEAEGRGELHAFFALFLPKVWKPLVALGALHFIALWGSFTSSFMYLSDASQSTPVLQFLRTFQSGPLPGAEPGDPLLLTIGALISLPSIALLLLFGRWLTSEVWVSQIRR